MSCMIAGRVELLEGMNLSAASMLETEPASFFAPRSLFDFAQEPLNLKRREKPAAREEDAERWDGLS